MAPNNGCYLLMTIYDAGEKTSSPALLCCQAHSMPIACGKHALSVFMGKFVLTAVFLLIVYVPRNYSRVQCTYGLAPTLINSAGCVTQSQLDAIFNRIDADVIPLIMAAQICLAPLGTVKSNPANSCREIYLANNSSQTGLYWLINSTGAVFQVTCRFDRFANFSSFNSNITNGFAVLTSLNMNDTTQQCPTPLKYLNSSGLRLCYKGVATSCVSLTVPTFGLSYQTVCGKMAGYEIGSDDGFHTSSTNIDSGYVDGVSITYGTNPRRHIWTYAIGVYQMAHTNSCPCTATGTAPPSFVGTNYYCESGNSGSSWSNVLYSGDLLWDGKNCGSASASCCTNQNQPWFCNRLNASIVGDVEMRICTNEAVDNEDVGLQSFEFYIQ